MGRVLVTGGAGFIGSHVAQRLLGEGREVVVLDDFNDFYDPQLKRENARILSASAGFTLVEGDIRDPGLVERLYSQHGISTTIHLAARAGVRPSISEPRLYSEVNELGTVNLLTAARDAGAKDFIFGSSSSVYGNSSLLPFTEQDPVARPVSPYAASKRAAELLCHTFHHLFAMRIICLRFFTVYGPRQRPEMAIHKFTAKLLRGEPVPLYGDGSSARDYTYVDDIADGVCAALDLAAGWEIINLGGSRSTKLGDLVNLIAASAGVEALIEHLGEQPGDVPITWADVSHAKEVLGWSPKVAIAEGIDRFVAWFRRVSDLPTE